MLQSPRSAALPGFALRRSVRARRNYAAGLLVAFWTVWPVVAERPSDGSDASGDVPTVGPGHASTHLIVHFERGFLDGRSVRLGEPLDGGPLDALNAAWGVTEIRPLLSVPARNAVLADRYGLNRTYVFVVPEGTDTRAMAAAYGAVAGVARAEVDGTGGIAELIPDDPFFPSQWNFRNTGQTGGVPGADVNATRAWELHTGRDTVTIAVLDTGIQADHPDLLGKVIPGYNTYDRNNDTSDPHGHGTHVAGIAGAYTNNTYGVAGMNWGVRLLAMTVVDDSGFGTEAPVADGIVWVVDNSDAQIISMSLQYMGGTDALRNAVAYAYDSGRLLVAAAGNQGSRNIAYPARFPKCMAVGMTDARDLRDSQSNYGPELDVVAPGRSIWSLNRNSGFSIRSGTSMATPHVSGLAALLLSYDACRTQADLENLIDATAHDLGLPGWDEEYGYGRIDSYDALLAAADAVRGDMNCDCTLDVFDIEGFILALFDPAGYRARYPNCDINHADTNGDGAVNAADIEEFIVILFGR